MCNSDFLLMKSGQTAFVVVVFEHPQTGRASRLREKILTQTTSTPFTPSIPLSANCAAPTRAVTVRKRHLIALGRHL